MNIPLIYPSNLPNQRSKDKEESVLKEKTKNVDNFIFHEMNAASSSSQDGLSELVLMSNQSFNYDAPKKINSISDCILKDNETPNEYEVEDINSQNTFSDVYKGISNWMNDCASFLQPIGSTESLTNTITSTWNSKLKEKRYICKDISDSNLNISTESFNARDIPKTYEDLTKWMDNSIAFIESIESKNEDHYPVNNTTNVYVNDRRIGADISLSNQNTNSFSFEPFDENNNDCDCVSNTQEDVMPMEEDGVDQYSGLANWMDDSNSFLGDDISKVGCGCDTSCSCGCQASKKKVHDISKAYKGIANWMADSNSFILPSQSKANSTCNLLRESQCNVNTEEETTLDDNKDEDLPESSACCSQNDDDVDMDSNTIEEDMIEVQDDSDAYSGLENWMSDIGSLVQPGLNKETSVCVNNIKEKDKPIVEDIQEKVCETPNVPSGYSGLENWVADMGSFIHPGLNKDVSLEGQCSSMNGPSCEEQRAPPSVFSEIKTFITDAISYISPDSHKHDDICIKNIKTQNLPVNEDNVQKYSGIENWMEDSISFIQPEVYNDVGCGCNLETPKNSENIKDDFSENQGENHNDMMLDASTDICKFDINRTMSSKTASVTFNLSESNINVSNEDHFNPSYNSENNGIYLEFMAKKSKSVKMIVNDPPEPVISYFSNDTCDMKFEFNPNVEMVLSRIPNKYIKENLDNERPSSIISNIC